MFWLTGPAVAVWIAVVGGVANLPPKFKRGLAIAGWYGLLFLLFVLIGMSILGLGSTDMLTKIVLPMLSIAIAAAGPILGLNGMPHYVIVRQQGLATDALVIRNIGAAAAEGIRFQPATVGDTKIELEPVDYLPAGWEAVLQVKAGTAAQVKAIKSFDVLAMKPEGTQTVIVYDHSPGSPRPIR